MLRYFILHDRHQKVLFLTDRYQRVKVNNYYSLWTLIKCGLPQDSILAPSLFNIFLCDMLFLVDSDIEN